MEEVLLFGRTDARGRCSRTNHLHDSKLAPDCIVTSYCKIASMEQERWFWRKRLQSQNGHRGGYEIAWCCPPFPKQNDVANWSDFEIL